MKEELKTILEKYLEKGKNKYLLYMVNGLHLYSAFIQSALQFMPLIHPFTHTFTHQRQRQTTALSS